MITKKQGKIASIYAPVIFSLVLLTAGFASANLSFNPAYAVKSETRAAIFMPSPTDELLKIINNRLNGHDVAMSFRPSIVNQYTYQNKLLLAQSFDAVKEAIKTAKTNSKPVGYIGYDNEADNLDLSTPSSELVNPSASTNTASDMVHKAGYKFAATPTRAILLREYQQVEWTKVDMLVMQLQQAETDKQTFTSTTTQVVPYIKAQNPNIVIFVQVNPDFDSVEHITADIKDISGLIDGVSIVCSIGCTPTVLDQLLTSINPEKISGANSMGVKTMQSDIPEIATKESRQSSSNTSFHNNQSLERTSCANAFTLICDGITTADEGHFDVIDDAVGEATSHYTISPPSFGDDYYHYSDGLTITQDKTQTTFDISQYNQEIPSQVMVAGKNVNMTFKTFEEYNPTAVVHMGLYIIPRGEDMITTNSIASIVYDKNLPIEVNDPNHILSDVIASSTSDGTFQYTQFSFVPTKSYDKMSFLARAWNDHHYSTDVRIHDALPMVSLKTLPAGVIMYENFDDLQAALEKDQFYKPQLMAHIHSTSDVFQSADGGHVNWLYDTIHHSVTLAIIGKNGNELGSFKQSLEHYDAEVKGDYKFMKFTVTQLNRWDENQEENAKSLEAAKAMSMAIKKGLAGHSNW